MPHRSRATSFGRTLALALILPVFASADTHLAGTELDRCLNEKEFPRVARVLDPDGRVVFARVTQQKSGRITRAREIAPDGTALSEVFARAMQTEGRDFDVADDRVCAVVPLPESAIDAETHVIVSTGLNFAAHAEEAGGGDVFLFPKPSAPTSPYARVHAPAGVTLFDYEVELAFVLLEDIDPFDPPGRDALLARTAFFLSNDVSDREAIVRNAALSGPGLGFVEGKGQRGFLPAGPWMVRGTELFDAMEACGAEGLGLRLRVDDEPELRQNASTTLMILPPEDLVARIGTWITEHGRRTPMPFQRKVWVDGAASPDGKTRFYPFAVGEDDPILTAGSIIQTGTPEGVALNAPGPLGITLRGLIRLRSPFTQFIAEEKARVAEGGTTYLAPGQTVRAEIDGLGHQAFEIGEAGGQAPPDPCSR